jgi:hypothetical protein
MYNRTAQAASALMMVRPVKFCYNEQTAVDNAFQKDQGSNGESVQEKALAEFDQYTSTLKSKGIEVAIFEDTFEPHTPDSIFPNNWISFHEDGTIVLYPMKALNRRLERRTDIIEGLEQIHNFEIKQKVDITEAEEEGLFLEGTGSIVFDYINRIAYACISQRTNLDLLNKVCNKIDFKVHAFTSLDENGKEIYHTNVMMCLGERFAMVCAQSVRNETEREALVKLLQETGHEIIFLTYEQINKFAGMPWKSKIKMERNF